MFYDLNVQWTSAKDPELPRTLAFLAELGYNIVALNYSITGKFPTDLVCATLWVYLAHDYGTDSGLDMSDTKPASVQGPGRPHYSPTMHTTA